MAIFTQKTIVILIFVEFLQVYFSHARYTEFAHEPREHLDSGQVPAGEPFLPWTRKSFERDRPLWSYDSSEEDQNDNENDELLFETTASLQEENTDDDLIESYWVNENNRNVNNDNLYSSESIENEIYFDVPSKRVRRRIIPIGGKGLERRRSDRRPSADPYGRSRSSYPETPLYRQRDAVVKRKGPTGSAALFSLYPELAPPDWRARRGIKKKSRKNERNKGTSTITGEDKIQNEENKRILKTEEESAPQKRQKIAPVPKRKAKLSKQLKEEIAVFAEQHGIDKAVSHFSSRLNLPMRPDMVEKFLTRYQTRIQRRASRS